MTCAVDKASLLGNINIRTYPRALWMRVWEDLNTLKFDAYVLENAQEIFKRILK
jgi:hypothetical protein